MTGLPDPDQQLLGRQPPPAILYSETWRDREMADLGDLAVFLHGSDDSFTGDLLRLMRKADPGNKWRLQLAFPWHHFALVAWEVTDKPTWGGLYDVWQALIRFTDTGQWENASEGTSATDSTAG